MRLSLIIVLDSLCVLIAIYFAQILVGASRISALLIISSSITLLLGHHLFSIQTKLYKKAWQYISIGELILMLKGITLSVLLTAAIDQIILREINFRLLITIWMLQLLLLGGSRLSFRFYRDSMKKPDTSKKRALIVGAGSAGTMVARQLLQGKDSELLPVAFIDDDIKKQHLDIYGIPVMGGRRQIIEIVNRLHIDNIVIAIPSLDQAELKTIFMECTKTEAKTQVIPMLEDLVLGKVSINHFRDVQVEDLLGRDPIALDIESISESIANKVVLVTGAGGSIGSEICRQICKFNPMKMILVGHGENSIYSIEMELQDIYRDIPIEIATEIADLQDKSKMFSIMRNHKPHVVYHAAAHKHVPLMERNPEEAVKNNIIGTINVAQAASRFGVETFVMISTDKAVNPSSVMGATKRLAEMMIQYMDRDSVTKFVAVRFGNVLGSRGSVIPRFKKQIEAGGPVTVTHPEMVRYFMTIPEASRLVIQAGALAKGGEIFVLDMGEPVKIVDLAKNLIKLSGYTVEDIGIEYTGVRPGEKLFEELLNQNEVQEQQIHSKIYIGKTAELYIEEIEELIDEYANLDRDTLSKCLLNLANHYVRTQELLSITG